MPLLVQEAEYEEPPEPAEILKVAHFEHIVGKSSQRK